MNALHYPRLIKRVRAVLIDSILLPVAAMTTLIAGDAMGVSGMSGKILLIALPLFILEPVMLSLTGGTVGHHLMGIKVSRKNGTGNINIAAATIRFIVKFLFGWFSFIPVLATRKHQAIHDLIARSIVTHRTVAGLPQYDVLPERMEEAGFVYPSAPRRFAVIATYIVMIVALLSIAVGFFFSDECLQWEHCSQAEKIAELFANLAFLFLTSAVIVSGWRSRLYGCRKRLLFRQAEA